VGGDCQGFVFDTSDDVPSTNSSTGTGRYKYKAQAMHIIQKAHKIAGTTWLLGMITSGHGVLAPIHYITLTQPGTPLLQAR